MRCLSLQSKAFPLAWKVQRLMSALRRYEILLPSQLNDGHPIPEDLLAETVCELDQLFGAVSSGTQLILGLWRQEWELYRDSLARKFIDAEDTAANWQFFIEFKQGLKKRFQQKEILVYRLSCGGYLAPVRIGFTRLSA
jgi:hypothetical protein